MADWKEKQEAYVRSREELNAEIKKLEEAKVRLAEEYRQQFFIKKDDCISVAPIDESIPRNSPLLGFRPHREGIPKCWVDFVRVCDEGDVVLVVSLPRNDGTRSKGNNKERINRSIGLMLETITIINESE